MRASNRRDQIIRDFLSEFFLDTAEFWALPTSDPFKDLHHSCYRGILHLCVGLLCEEMKFEGYVTDSEFMKGANWYHGTKRLDKLIDGLYLNVREFKNTKNPNQLCCRFTGTDTDDIDPIVQGFVRRRKLLLLQALIQPPAKK